MIRYIPDFILHNYELNNLNGCLNAYVLLCDVADFTSISTELQKHGKGGAEELSRFLYLVFSEPIHVVHRYGGFASLFAGDAFCAVFPEGEPEGIISAVNSITAFFKDKSVYTCSLGEFILKVRQTVCHGTVDWQIYENKLQNEYVFSGATLQELSDLTAAKEYVVFSDASATIIGIQHFEKLDLGYRLIKDRILSEGKPLALHYTPETKARFINPKYCNESPQNEIRSAAYCFANLEGVAAKDREQTIRSIQSLADRYGGYVNKYDATDKGLIAIILFGLPRSEDKTLERICNFSMEVVDTNPDIALGISCGSVFAGYTGSGEIREFTALGAPMNLAARLMSKARAGEVLTDTFLWQEMNAHYDFDYLGSLNLKGIALPVRYYHLSRQSKDKAWHQESRFVGRDEELATIRTLVDSSIVNKEKTIIYVSGDAGIGKSRLVKEALAIYPISTYHKFFITCDAILSKPLEAIKQIIRTHFYYNPQLPEEAGIGMFRALWAVIAAGDAEMQRIESIIASLLGYEWSGSIWSVLPPEEKPNQLKHAFIRFMEQLTKTKPVLIHLDDGQWLDSESEAYLQALSGKEIKPIVMVCPCRYLDNGNRADMELSRHKRADIDLNSLSDSGSTELIKTILRLPQIPQATLSLITERAMGNPLFIEQLASYLMECGSINDKGIIPGEVGYLSSFSISDIVSSRIDRLSEKVRECMFSASVLGMEFNVKVLSQMLNNDLKEQLETGVNNRIWKDVDELRYIFTHVLIKDIVYQRMVNEKLKALHQTAAESMEIVYADKLDEYAEDIALHFEKAELEEKTARYLDKAGCWLRDKFTFAKSELHLRKALVIREKVLGAEHPDTAKSLNNLATLYRNQCKYKQAELLYLRALEIREKVLGAEHPDTALSLNNLAEMYKKQFKDEQAEPLYLRALEIREKVLGAEHPDTASSLNNLAKLYSWQFKYDQAEPLFLRALEIREKVLGAEHPDTAMTLSSLAMLYNVQGKYEQAEPLNLRALEIREKVLGAEHPDTASSLNSLAILYDDQGKHEQTEPLYLRALEIKENVLGAEHPATAVSLYFLASLYSNQGKYDLAEPLYLRALAIREKVLGAEYPHTALPLNDLGYLYKSIGKYSQAENHFLRAIDIWSKTIGLKSSWTIEAITGLIDLYVKMGETEKVAQYRAMLPDESNPNSE